MRWLARFMLLSIRGYLPRLEYVAAVGRRSRVWLGHPRAYPPPWNVALGVTGYLREREPVPGSQRMKAPLRLPKSSAPSSSVYVPAVSSSAAARRASE